MNHYKLLCVGRYATVRVTGFSYSCRAGAGGLSQVYELPTSRTCEALAQAVRHHMLKETMVMRSETIGEDEVGGVDWDESHFKFCEFRNVSIEGRVVCYDFVSCSFTNVDWYSGLFSASNFIDCQFTDCIFRGCAFPDSRCVDCTFVNCGFTKDNVDAACDFAKTISYGNILTGTEGFMYGHLDE